jgi:hypothetical protein
MDTKKTILIYQHAERIKSELIIASRLMAILDSLKGEERKGAEIRKFLLVWHFFFLFFTHIFL